MVEGAFRRAHRQGHHYLGLVGEIRYKLSGTLNRYIEEVFAGDLPASLLLDLTETRAIDSTNLGLLAKAARLMAERGGEQIRVISPNPDITAVLEAMCLDQVFLLVTEPAGTSLEWRQLEEDQPDRVQAARILLEAHQTIMAVSPENRPKFQDLVDTLSRELEATTP